MPVQNYLQKFWKEEANICSRAQLRKTVVIIFEASINPLPILVSGRMSSEYWRNQGSISFTKSRFIVGCTCLLAKAFSFLSQTYLLTFALTLTFSYKRSEMAATCPNKQFWHKIHLLFPPICQEEINNVIFVWVHELENN